MAPSPPANLIVPRKNRRTRLRRLLSLRARQGVAISWYGVQIRTTHQEIATSGFASSQ